MNRTLKSAVTAEARAGSRVKWISAELVAPRVPVDRFAGT
jgi:hypothetical protein